jgi:hypothetical protein
MLSSSPAIDFEVLRVGETDLELECNVSPAVSTCGGMPVVAALQSNMMHNAQAAKIALLWSLCRSVVVEARAYEMNNIAATSMAISGLGSHVTNHFPNGAFFPDWKQVGLTCIARAAAGSYNSGASSDQPEAFTVRIVGLKPHSTCVVVLAVYPADAYDSGVDARAQFRRCCWMPLRTLALPTYVRCMDRSDSMFRLSVTRPDNATPLHAGLTDMIAKASPYASSLMSSKSKQRRAQEMKPFLELLTEGRLLTCDHSHGATSGDTIEDNELETVDSILITPLGEACLWRHQAALRVLTKG